MIFRHGSDLPDYLIFRLSILVRSLNCFCITRAITNFGRDRRFFTAIDIEVPTAEIPREDFWKMAPRRTQSLSQP